MVYYEIKGVDFEEKLLESGFTQKQINKHLKKFYLAFSLIVSKMLNSQKKARGKSEDIFEFKLNTYNSVFGRISIKDKENGETSEKRLLNLAVECFDDWGIINKYYIKPKNFAWWICNIKLPENIIGKLTRIKFAPDEMADLEEKLKTTEIDYSTFLTDSDLTTYNKLKEYSQQIELDKRGVYKYISSNTSKPLSLGYHRNSKGQVEEKILTQDRANYWRIATDNFENKTFSVSKKTHRYYTNLTNLPKQLRMFLHYEGKKFIEIDVKNSQPLLLYNSTEKWLNNEAILTTYSDEELAQLEEYKAQCEQGNLYQSFKSGMDDMKLKYNEKTFKTDFLSKTLFCKEPKPKDENEDKKVRIPSYRRALKKKYKIIDDCISFKKKSDHAALAVELQQIEADLIVKKISKSIIKETENPFFTIHDAIYCLEEDVALVNEIIKEEYQKIGLNPSVHINRAPKVKYIQKIKTSKWTNTKQLKTLGLL